MRDAIFISYRRADSQSTSGRIYDWLVRRYHNRLFMDVDGIPPGDDFRSVIDRRLAQTKIMLAIIGPDWLDAQQPDGSGKVGRRLDDPDDIVRSELRDALRSPDIRVIPLLVQDARLPDRSALPSDLATLVDINAVAVRPGEFRHDIKQLEQVLGRELPSPRWPWLVGGFATVSLVASVGGRRPLRPPSVDNLNRWFEHGGWWASVILITGLVAVFGNLGLGAAMWRRDRVPVAGYLSAAATVLLTGLLGAWALRQFWGLAENLASLSLALASLSTVPGIVLASFRTAGHDTRFSVGGLLLGGGVLAYFLAIAFYLESILLLGYAVVTGSACLAAWVRHPEAPEGVDRALDARMAIGVMAAASMSWLVLIHYWDARKWPLILTSCLAASVVSAGAGIALLGGKPSGPHRRGLLTATAVALGATLLFFAPVQWMFATSSE